MRVISATPLSCLAAVGTLVVVSAGCLENEDALTAEEFQVALDEAVASGEGEGLITGVIEVSTTFTIGDAVDAAAQNLRDWLESQIDCSTVTVESNTVSMDFGTLDDNCVYNGHTYAGISTATVSSNQADHVQVDHGWTGLTNGEITLDGTANVDWTTDVVTRHVVHNLTWTNAAGEEIAATGERMQAFIDDEAGILGGIVVDGYRDWTSSTGDWHLEIDGVEMRLQDPVPQAGSYTLTTPEGKLLTLDFERVDELTIQVTVTDTRQDHVFEITSVE